MISLSVLSDALERESLVPCFQPLVELRSGKLIGFEVLARWQEPGGGLILPKNLISLAEKSGMIGTLTQQMLRKALAAGAAMPSSLSLAVNVSPFEFRDQGLPKMIRNIANEAGFSLDRLTIEITESAILDNMESAAEIARELKAMGCRLALDDFGTGYSSLLHIQALPFDELKVDLKFVQAMTRKRESRKIVGAVIGLSHSLGILAVAEGVETEEQAEMLLRLGCHQGQGWLYGHPVVAESISSIAAASPHAMAFRPSTSTGSKAPLCIEAFPADQVAQLRAIYDGAPVGLSFIDREFRHVSINRRLAEIDGFPVHAHLGRTVAEMNPQAFGFIEPFLRRALQGETISDLEVSIPGPQPGETRTFIASYQPAVDELGEVIGISIAVAEISERKRVEEALRESESHYRSFIDLSPHAAWVMDLQGNLTEMSPRWTEMTGLTQEQSLGRGWLAAVHPDDVARRLEALSRSLATGVETDIEYRIKAADGSWRWVRSRGRPCYGPSGAIVRWYGCLEDIDARKREHENLTALSRLVERCPNRENCLEYMPGKF